MYYSEALLNLIPITKTSGGPLQYSYDVENSIRLPGAHGEEIVRDMYTDIHASLFLEPFMPRLTSHRHVRPTHAAKTATSAHGS